MKIWEMGNNRDVETILILFYDRICEYLNRC